MVSKTEYDSRDFFWLRLFLARKSLQIKYALGHKITIADQSNIHNGFIAVPASEKSHSVRCRSFQCDEYLWSKTRVKGLTYNQRLKLPAAIHTVTPNQMAAGSKTSIAGRNNGCAR